MLVVTRRVNESILIFPETYYLQYTVAELFRDGPLTIQVVSTGSSFTRLGVSAHDSLRILRNELTPK
ncbi:MAG: hypothetical protein Tsb002_37980 [Wenzhouxiangellaceae bacterium]